MLSTKSEVRLMPLFLSILQTQTLIEWIQKSLETKNYQLQKP